MKIEDILKLIEEDKKIDYTQLDTESLKIPEQAVKYQQLAQKNNLSLAQVETLAGKKAVEKTASGHFIKIKGKWIKK